MKKYFPYILLLMVWLLGYVFHIYPEWTELYYSSTSYAVISRFLRLIFGWLPFSLGDILYTTIALYSVYFIIRYFKKIRKKPLWFLGKITRFISMIIVLFYLLWGFNYNRIPLSKQLNINTKYSKEQLFKTTEHFLKESNCLHLELVQNDTLAVEFPFTNNEIFEESVRAYNNLSVFYPHWDYSYPSVKESLYSEVLSYMGYSGYLNPFTNEAQVNSRIVSYQLPVTTCHEISHQLGYSAEQEANFMGYLACLYSSNQHFNYSASLFALSYCLSEVRKVDAERYQSYTNQINKGILKNYQESHDFWLSYKNPFEPIFKESYDAYLKANRQTQGIDSYNWVVGLLIGYYWKSL